MHVITGLRTGGAENQLLLLARHTRTSPTVVALTNADEVAEKLRSEGVEVLDLGMRSNRDVAAVRRLARYMARQRPDVVHLHLYRATIYGRLAAFLARIPVVVTTEHSLLEGQLEGRRTTLAVRGLYLATEPWNKATIAVSPEVAGRLIHWGVPRRKVHVVPNAVDFAALRPGRLERSHVRSELGVPLDAKVIGGIGRLHSGKRWDLLISAMAAQLGPCMQLLLVGSGEEEARLRQMALSLGVSEWVHMAGSRSDLAAVLSAMDVVVSPSPQETFGLALVEAAAAGRPIVYVDSPGIAAIGPFDGATRVAADAPAIREAVRVALERPGQAYPPKALRRYDVNSVADQVDSLYEDLLVSSRSSRRVRS